MATVSGGDKADKYLRELAERLGNAGSVSVGFFEDATYPESTDGRHPAGTPIAYIAAIQNYGEPSLGIPPRPFFTNMVREKAPSWGDDVAVLLKTTDGDAAKALALLGEQIADQLRDSIDETNSPPLAQATIDKKGSDKPLIDSGEMRKSVRSEVE